MLLAGRTGRFGRKGVSINFVHNKKTWEDMHMIEVALGRDCIRVETNDIDVMEEVRLIVVLASGMSCADHHNP